ncbi:MAG: hypothetical protein U0234_28790 [Sandaracinus sp.]|nr:hypothetical protein [Sandaracinaceae bacterium]
MENPTVHIGEHTFRLHPPSVVVLRYVGTLEEEHAQRITDLCRETSRRPFAIVCDTAQLAGVSPPARRKFAEGFKGVPLVAAAFVRASMRTRALATFVVTAINMMRDTKIATGFFEDEGAAETWALGIVGELES